MGRRPLDTNERANNVILRFYKDLNERLAADPILSKSYTLQQMCEEFSKELNRSTTFSKSSMTNILKRNGLHWDRKKKQITPILDSLDYEVDDLEIVEKIYKCFILTKNYTNKKIIRDWLETDIQVTDDVLAVLTTPKGLLVLSSNPSIKKTLQSKIKDLFKA